MKNVQHLLPKKKNEIKAVESTPFNSITPTVIESSCDSPTASKSSPQAITESSVTLNRTIIQSSLREYTTDDLFNSPFEF